MARLARWDRATAGRVDVFVANSRYVAGRIRRYYNRGSVVVYPPVDTALYRPADNPRPVNPGVLVVSALVPYKKVDLAIAACREARVPLTIVGTGPERARLERAAGPEVEFLGWRADEEIRQLYQQSAAVLLPGVEDFGIVPVEAQACGCPVIAAARGGAAETVVHGETGLLVEDPTAPAFAEAIARVRGMTFDTSAMRQHALRFSRQRFLDEFRSAVESALHERGRRTAAAAADPMIAAGDREVRS